MWYLILFLGGLLILIGFLLGFSPYVSRKEYVFSISIPSAYQESSIIKKNKHNFALLSLGGAVLLTLLSFFFANGTSDQAKAMNLTLYFIAAYTLYLVFSCVIFLHYRQKISVWKTSLPRDTSQKEQVLVIDTNFRKRHLIVPTQWLVIFGVIVILLTLLITFLRYPSIPSRIPVHWNLSGTKADQYAAKSIGTLLLMPFIQLVLLIILSVANHSLTLTKQKITGSEPEKSALQNQQFRLANSRLLVSLTLIILIFLFVIQLQMISGNAKLSPIFFILCLLLVLAALGGAIFLAFRYGQGGERWHKREHTASFESASDMQDKDEYWKLGTFYYNPKDSSLWVEKRFGFGVTLNYGNRRAWYYTCGLIVLLGFMIVASLLFV